MLYIVQRKEKKTLSQKMTSCVLDSHLLYRMISHTDMISTAYLEKLLTLERLPKVTPTSVNLCLSCPGCFLANSRMTSGVLNASLMAAWIAYEGTEERKDKEKKRIESTTQQDIESSKTEFFAIQ